MSTKEPRISLQGLKVLSAFVDSYPEELTGSVLMDLTGAASGSLYPLLARFEQAGWLTSKWEQESPADLGRPRRRYYRLTGVGKACALKYLHEIEGGRLRVATV